MCYPYSSITMLPSSHSSQFGLSPQRFAGSGPPSPLFHRSLRTEDISLSLTSAIQAGDFRLAMLEIQNNSHLVWRLNQGSVNPLHALANSSFPWEQKLALSTLLLKIGYDPFLRNQEGFDYICLLILPGDLPAKFLYDLIKEALDWHALTPASFLLIYDLILESPAYSSSEKYELISSICLLTSEEATCALIETVLQSHLEILKKGVSFSIQIAIDILIRRNLINNLKINDFQDHFGRNLIHMVLLDDTSDAKSKYFAIHSLVLAGADIEHRDVRGRFPLLLALKGQAPFQAKKWLAEMLLQLGAKKQIVFQGTTTPTFASLFTRQLSIESKKELSCLSELLTGKDYYSEYFHLSLLGNLFGEDIHWELDGFTFTLTGLSIYETQIGTWLENEAYGFYQTLLDSNAPLHESFYQEVCSSIDVSWSLSERGVFFREIAVALQEAKRILSTAFSLGRQGRGNLLQAINSTAAVGFIATAPVDHDSYHDIGLLFRNKTAYLCNKGFGSLQHGISEHPFPYFLKKKNLILDLTSGKRLLEIVGKYFPERSLFIRNDAAMILSQHQQAGNNCPIASYTSLELAILYTRLCMVYPDDSDKAKHVARAILATHRSHRQLLALSQYLSLHSSPREVPIHSEILFNLFGKSLHSEKKRAIAEMIESWAKKYSPALSACIFFALGTTEEVNTP